MSKSDEYEYLTSKNYRCKECGHRDISYGFIKGDEFLWDTFEPCSECNSSDLQYLISVPNIDRFGERFPYFDRGLGCMLTSKKHRLDVCKEKGVVPIDGDIDYSPEASKIQQSHAEEDRIVADIQDKIEHHPGYAEYRKQKDQGWKPKFKHRGTKDSGVDPFKE